jgi:hypothetical protein
VKHDRQGVVKKIISLSLFKGRHTLTCSNMLWHAKTSWWSRDSYGQRENLLLYQDHNTNRKKHQKAAHDMLASESGTWCVYIMCLIIKQKIRQLPLMIIRLLGLKQNTSNICSSS